MADTLSALVEASGPLNSAREQLDKIELPKQASEHLKALFSVAEIVQSQAPNIMLTIDLVENRGLQYHTGLTFFLFAKGSTREIGRGGRYQISHAEGVSEPATGATLFMDSLVTVSPFLPMKPCVYVPHDTSRTNVSKLQSQGFRTRVSLSSEKDSVSDAKALGCTHIMQDGEAVEVSN